MIEDVQQSNLNKSNPKVVLRNVCSSSLGEYDELKTTLTRILVCKPHSADWERLVSVYSSLKTSSRNRLQLQTISHYLHVNINILVLSKFDPKPTVHRFINERRRRVKETPKVDRQSWFKKVFENDAADEEVQEGDANKIVTETLNRSF